MPLELSTLQHGDLVEFDADGHLSAATAQVIHAGENPVCLFDLDGAEKIKLLMIVGRVSQIGIGTTRFDHDSTFVNGEITEDQYALLIDLTGVAKTRTSLVKGLKVTRSSEVIYESGQ